MMSLLPIEWWFGGIKLVGRLFTSSTYAMYGLLKALFDRFNLSSFLWLNSASLLFSVDLNFFV